MVNIKNLVLGIGIIVVFALALWQGIEAFYPSPQYEKFCPNYYPQTPTIKNGISCNSSLELSNQESRCYQQRGSPIYDFDVNGCPVSVKECDLCNLDLEKAQDEHAKKAFYIALIVGLITLIVGYSILTIEPVGSALIGSGIWSFFWGTVVNWRNLSSIWRFLLLLLALILIIYITIRLNTNRRTIQIPMPTTKIENKKVRKK